MAGLVPVSGNRIVYMWGCGDQETFSPLKHVFSPEKQHERTFGTEHAWSNLISSCPIDVGTLTFHYVRWVGFHRCSPTRCNSRLSDNVTVWFSCIYRRREGNRELRQIWQRFHFRLLVWAAKANSAALVWNTEAKLETTGNSPMSA